MEDRHDSASAILLQEECKRSVVVVKLARFLSCPLRVDARATVVDARVSRSVDACFENLMLLLLLLMLMMLDVPNVLQVK